VSEDNGEGQLRTVLGKVKTMAGNIRGTIIRNQIIRDSTKDSGCPTSNPGIMIKALINR